MAMREADMQRAILQRLGDMDGVYIARTSAVACYLPDGRGGYRLHRPLPVGWPDIVAVVRGTAVAIEVKAPSLRRRDGSAPLSPDQERVCAAWTDAGGVWITASALADVDRVVEMARGM